MQVVANLEDLNETSVAPRFKQGNTAIIIARADHISTGCRFEFTSPGGRSCCYTSVLGHSLDHQQDLCPAAEEKKEVTEEKIFFVSARGQVNLFRYLTIESTPTSNVKIC